MIRVLEGTDESGVKYYAVHCPACKCGHKFDGRWKFNGDFERPTFTPSMLVKPYSTTRADGSIVKLVNQCHSFVTDGRIQYLGDCEHEMAGQTVDLPVA